MKVNVPFAFENESQHLPAGFYTLETKPGAHILIICGMSSSGKTLIDPDGGARSAKTNRLSSVGIGNVTSCVRSGPQVIRGGLLMNAVVRAFP
jgi:hypothetical protein